MATRIAPGIPHLARRLRRIAAFAATPGDKAQVYAVGVWLALRDSVPRRTPRRSSTIHVVVGGRRVALRVADRTGFNIIEEVLLDGDYAKAGGRSATQIVDLGANVGIAALYFRSLYPAARILAVEPDPRTFELLAANVAHDPGIRCVQAAVTATSGPVRFSITPLSWASHIADGDGGDTANTIMVRGVSLDDLLAEEQIESIDVLKVDVEGEEWRLLEGARCLDQTKFVIGEFHGDTSGADDFLARISARHGFTETGRDGQLFSLAR